MGETREWETWQQVWGLAKGFNPELDRVPNAALYRLREYGQMWRRWRDTRDPMSLRYQPLLAYAIAREGLGRSPLLAKWAEQFVELAPGAAQGPGGLEDLSLIAQLLILSKGGTRQ